MREQQTKLPIHQPGTVSDEPLVGVPSHTAAAALGALAMGAATGAVAGTAAGPVGTLIGAAVGAVIGGLGGDAVASAVEDVPDHNAYWRENFRQRPYVSPEGRYDDYGPAYILGYTSVAVYPGQTFDDAEPHLARDWDGTRSGSTLDWATARPAARDAFDRLRQEREDAERRRS